MTERWTLMQLALETLDKSDHPLTPEEIWQEAEKFGYTSFVQTTSKTPWKIIKGIIVSDILKRPYETIFLKISEDSDYFYLKNKKYIEPKKPAIFDEKQEIELKFSERQLHPLLATFALSNEHLMCATKTIIASGGVAKKKNFYQWTYPDMVGIQFPDNFSDTSWSIHNLFNGNLITIFSFELKKALDYNNLKDSFFQAVSNSSWAHEGYLVAAKIRHDEQLKKEIRNLSNSFGIGIIHLNIDSIFESEILYKAKRKITLNHNFINNLILKNKDFQQFMELVFKSSKEHKIDLEDFDKTLNEEEILEYVKNLYQEQTV